jgi:hypothetical protein
MEVVVMVAERVEPGDHITANLDTTVSKVGDNVTSFLDVAE